MIRAARQPTRAWRHVFMTLAVLAIALKILVPTGFMAGVPSNGSGFPLVLCTGQGVVVVGPGEALPSHPDPAKAPDSAGHDSPCAFAGHGLGTAPPNLFEVGGLEFFVYRSAAPQALTGLAPGRGLAGPPLPARGPPNLLI